MVRAVRTARPVGAGGFDAIADRRGVLGIEGEEFDDIGFVERVVAFFEPFECARGR
jgi:hypothetical protein